MIEISWFVNGKEVTYQIVIKKATMEIVGDNIDVHCYSMGSYRELENVIESFKGYVIEYTRR